MSQSVAVPPSAGRPKGPGVDETRLHGHWLTLARIGWVTVTLTLVVLNVLAFRDLYGAYFTYTPQVLHTLHQIGLSPTLYSVAGILLNTVVFQVVFLLLGLLLFLRRSDDRMALFCAFTLVTFGSAVTLFNFSSGDVVPTLAANPILHVVSLVLFGVGETSFVVFFYLFPSGRFVPLWTRWAALVVAIYYLAVVFFPAMASNAGGPFTYVIPVYLLTAVMAQIYRYRRISTPKEQQQTKWVVFGFVLAILIIVLNVPLGFLLPTSVKDNQVLANLNPLFPVGLLLIPIFIVIAILRSQLWDIDTIINKALVYGSLTAILAALYAGLIIGLESVAGLVTRQASDPVVLVISTLATFVLFTPLRQRIQALIDRRFYRRKYDAEKTLAAFSETLRNEVDLSELRAHVLAVVNETMQPASVSLWLAQPERHPQDLAYHLEAHGQEAGRPSRD
ncbi:MAG: hypothetical protein ACLQUY_06335 [Ktedonobacterales bacterium]